jgi:tRNA(fMet)-specific endonuclease VapC
MAELYVWAHNRADPSVALKAIDTMLFHEVSILDFDRDCADEFGRVRVAMRRQGLELNAVDLMIASVALVYDLILVTHNTGDFQNVPGLQLDDWL